MLNENLVPSSYEGLYGGGSQGHPSLLKALFTGDADPNSRCGFSEGCDLLERLPRRSACFWHVR
jgi:hypothetical protein